MMKKGIFVLKGKVLEPPYVIRQQADKIFINEEVIYPFSEIEQPEVKPGFEAEAELPQFTLPEKIKKTLESFQKSWASGLVRDERGLVKKGAGLERDEEDFIRDAEGAKMDASSFIQDYESEKTALKQVLESQDIPFKETEKYHDVLVPVKKEWGVVALFNEAERMRVTQQLDKEKPVPHTYPYQDAANFKRYIEAGLREGDMIVIDDNMMEIVPRKLVKKVEKETSGFDALGMEEKADTLMKKISPDLKRPTKPIPDYPLDLSAVIFFPHLSWQREAVGKHSTFPFTLAWILRLERYRVRLYWDTMVTLSKWAWILKTGRQFNLKAIYNEGHGNANMIAVGEPHLKGGWYYFTDQFVYNYANLRKTVVYMHSCLTLYDNRLSSAFLKQGAGLYAGWKQTTSADPHYCDVCDRIFWYPLVSGSTTGEANKALHEFDSNFDCRGDPNIRLP
jgi:hypothetical protein